MAEMPGATSFETANRLETVVPPTTPECGESSSDSLPYHEDSRQDDSATEDTELWGVTLPKHLQKDFSLFIAQLTYATSLEQDPFDSAVKARSAEIFRELRENPPGQVSRVDYLIWLVRAVTTATIAGELESARQLAEREDLTVLTQPEDWLPYVGESVLIACVELFGEVPRNWSIGGDSAAARLPLIQGKYEKAWMDALEPCQVSVKKLAAIELLGHYHLASGLINVARFRAGQLDQVLEKTSEDALKAMDKALGYTGIAYGHADETEWLLLVPLVKGACRVLLETR
jgi:hypothetical protein